MIEREGGLAFLQRFSKLRSLQAAVEEYYNGAFSPELTQALQFAEESGVTAGLVLKHIKAEADSKATTTLSSTRYQTNLYYIETLI